MATCSFCGTTILFGGKTEGSLHLCNQKCLEKGAVVRLDQQIPADDLQEFTQSVHQGACPKCQGPGPVDMHISYRVISMLIMTRWSSRPQLSCRSCAVKSKLGDAAICLARGWWGIPWGLIFTPVQIMRNIIGIVRPPDASKPSERLLSYMRAELATRAIRQQAANAATQQ